MENAKYFMEPEGSLHFSQEPAIGICSEPGECSPHPHIVYLSDPA
jgi:hypothetical protein